MSEPTMTDIESTLSRSVPAVRNVSDGSRHGHNKSVFRSEISLYLTTYYGLTHLWYTDGGRRGTPDGLMKGDLCRPTSPVKIQRAKWSSGKIMSPGRRTRTQTC